MKEFKIFIQQQMLLGFRVYRLNGQKDYSKIKLMSLYKNLIIEIYDGFPYIFVKDNFKSMI